MNRWQPTRKENKALSGIKKKEEEKPGWLNLYAVKEIISYQLALCQCCQLTTVRHPL
jgi:hypothetical protein